MSVTSPRMQLCVCEKVEILNLNMMTYARLRNLRKKGQSLAWEVLSQTFFKTFWEGSDMSKKSEESDLH